MSDSPVLLRGVVCCEQAIVCAIADFLQTLGDDFAESLLIADLIDQLM